MRQAPSRLVRESRRKPRLCRLLRGREERGVAVGRDLAPGKERIEMREMPVVVVVAKTRVEPFAKSAALVCSVGRKFREHLAPARGLRVVDSELRCGGKRMIQKFAHER